MHCDNFKEILLAYINYLNYYFYNELNSTTKYL